jgi:hypothetical protein
MVNVNLTFDPKINSGHLLVMNNHHTKFKVPRPWRSLVITRKPVNVTLTFDPKSIEFLGLNVLLLSLGNRFYLQGRCDLDLWPIDPKINLMGVICWSWKIIIKVWSFEALGFFSYHTETVFTYKVNVTLTFEPLTLKSIVVICWSWTIIIPSLKFLGLDLF